MYEVSTTIFKNCGGFKKLELKRGVKQGDPLSSILFNMVHDPLLERLEDQGGGLQVGDHSILCSPLLTALFCWPTIRWQPSCNLIWW